MKLERKDRLYLLGALLFLAKSVVQEPYDKAVVTWEVPHWLLSTVSLLTVVAILVLGIVSFWPNRKPPNS